MYWAVPVGETFQTFFPLFALNPRVSMVFPNWGAFFVGHGGGHTVTHHIGAGDVCTLRICDRIYEVTELNCSDACCV